MCGAFSVLHPFKEVGRHFNAGYNDSYEFPRYNVRPTQLFPIVMEHEGKVMLVNAVWGIQPVFMKGKMLFNTRDESVATKPYFERLFLKQRCLVPADGFYEWQHSGSKKIPYYFSLKGKDIFGFAGIWETNKELKQLEFSILTTEPNPLVATVHNRMPVIIPHQKELEYISPNQTAEELLKLLKPYPAKNMQMREVSTLVNSAKNETSDILK